MDKKVFSGFFGKVRPRIECDPAFRAVILEADRLRLFKEFVAVLEEAAASRRHSSRKHSKKSKKTRRRSQSPSQSRVSYN